MDTARRAPQLRGQSQIGAHLPSAALAGLDLRGTDFTGADLRDADLSHIRSGMSRTWTCVVVFASLLLSIGIGVVAGIYTHYIHSLYASGDLRVRLVAWFVTAMLLAFIGVAIAKGLIFALRTVVPVGAGLAIIVGVVMVVSGHGTGNGILLALTLLALVVLVVALSVLVRALAGTAGKMFFTLVALAGGLAGAAVGGGLAAGAIAVSAMLMAHRSAKLKIQYPLLARVIAAIASHGGTSFRNANLAGANLADTRLIACDFRGATLTGARFDGATMTACRIDRADQDQRAKKPTVRHKRGESS
jgi:hypothetical protein